MERRANVVIVRSRADNERDAVATRFGNSGGPVLAGDEIVGVLSRHHDDLPRRSIYTSTTSPTNAGWLRSVLEL